MRILLMGQRHCQCCIYCSVSQVFAECVCHQARHRKNFWGFTGPRIDFGLILLISNMIIHRSFTSPTHLLSAVCLAEIKNVRQNFQILYRNVQGVWHLLAWSVSVYMFPEHWYNIILIVTFDNGYGFSLSIANTTSQIWNSSWNFIPTRDVWFCDCRWKIGNWKLILKWSLIFGWNWPNLIWPI